MPGNYSISDIYQGGYSSLNPDYGSVFTGYRASASTIGVSTDPRTANILKEVSEKINPGQKVIELSLIDLGAPLDTITKQQLEEVKRLGKLTGVDITVHGPITDASGFKGQVFSDSQREMVEKKLMNSIERSHEVDDKGNIMVTFHTSNELPGPVWKRDEKGEMVEETSYAVNVETGQLAPLKREEKFYPHLDKKGEIREEKHSVDEQLDILNKTQWGDSLDGVEFQRESAERIIENTHPVFIGKYLQMVQKQLNGEKIDPNKEFSPEEKGEINKIYSAEAYLREAQKKANSLFHNAYSHGTENEKKFLKELVKKYEESLGRNDEQKAINQYNPRVQSDALLNLTKGLNQLQPKLFRPAEEYALEKTAETYGNVAIHSYQKYKDKAPIISIENPPAGGGLSRGRDVRNVVEKSKEHFVSEAVKAKSDGGLGMSESEAKNQADKLIGVTWDVGHINQLRKFGFTGKDIIKEAKEVAPLVKHIHLSDNFGMDNIELPMGMGNVDLKEVMKELGEKGEKAKKIVEAAHWWQFHQSNPVGPTFEALGSPLYPGGPGFDQTIGLHQGYFGGYGAMLPPINYETFGAGFSNLPSELGGQRQGGVGGRMSGRSME